MTDPVLKALPACGKMALTMAREVWGVDSCARVGMFDSLHERCMRLLADLDRPESRDAWVRWLLAHDTRPPKARSYLDLRDNPTALLAAILEVCHAR